MAKRHHVTMEVGGWILLAAVIAFILWLLFHKTQGGTAVQSSLVPIGGGTGIPVGPPSIKLDDPTKPASYTSPDGTLYVWDVPGQQWHVSSASQPFLVINKDPGPGFYV